MNGTALPSDAARYLDEVRAHLGPLAPDEREDLLDDLATHLRELAADDDRPPHEVLGPPAAFAAEALASAGVAPGDGGDGRPGPVDRLRAQAEAWAGHPWGRAVRAFLPELRPAWWVLRGYVAVLAVSLLLGGETVETLPVPKLFGTVLLGIPATVAAVVASVRLGRRPPARGWARAVDLAAVVALVVLVGTVKARAMPEYTYYAAEASASNRLTHPDGTPITNIWPYDRDGRLLDGVLLYDQAGRPVTVGEAYDERSGLPLEAEPPLDANGAPVEHAYPLEQDVDAEANGLPAGEGRVRPPSVVVPPLSSSLTSTTTTSTTTTTTAPPAEAPATTAPPTTTAPPPG